MKKEKATQQYYRIKADAEFKDLPEFLQIKIEKLICSEREKSYKDGYEQGQINFKNNLRETAAIKSAPMPDSLEMAAKLIRNIQPYDQNQQDQILNAMLFSIKQARAVRAQLALEAVENGNDHQKAMYARSVISLNSLKDLLG